MRLDCGKMVQSITIREIQKIALIIIYQSNLEKGHWKAGKRILQHFQTHKKHEVMLWY